MLKIMYFLSTSKERKYDINFDPEDFDIPYNETAKLQAEMDIEDRSKEKRLDQAKQVYVDLKDFFVDDDNCKYLLSVVKIQDIVTILEEIEECFLRIEDYGKCRDIASWRKKLFSNLPPDIEFDHLY